MSKIILAGLVKDKNLGDQIIYDSFKYLFNRQSKNFKDEDFRLLDLDEFNSIKKEDIYLIRKIKGFVNKFIPQNNEKRLNKLVDEYSNYYTSQIEDASLIIFVGGGLVKYAKQQTWLYISGIISSAEKLGVNVILSAVGVEGYDKNNIKCRMIEHALNKKVVKMITTRDDLTTLINNYLNQKNEVIYKKVADPAVYASEVYGVNRDVSSETIGVGLIRSNIFKDYGIDYSNEDLINLYSELLLELDQRKIKWQLFTNGLPSDCDLAEDILMKIDQIDQIGNIKTPNSPKDLVEIISKFRGVIAVRLHACIISYSLEIPVIGLVWNNKSSFFGENIGYRDRFITSNNFNKRYIIDKLLAAIDEGYDIIDMKHFKSTITDSMIDIMEINKLRT